MQGLLSNIRSRIFVAQDSLLKILCQESVVKNPLSMNLCLEFVVQSPLS